MQKKSGNIRAKPLDFRASNGASKKIFGQETSAPPPPPPQTKLVPYAYSPHQISHRPRNLGVSAWRVRAPGHPGTNGNQDERHRRCLQVEQEQEDLRVLQRAVLATQREHAESGRGLPPGREGQLEGQEGSIQRGVDRRQRCGAKWNTQHCLPAAG